MVHSAFLVQPENRKRQHPPQSPHALTLSNLLSPEGTGNRELRASPELCGQPRMPFSKNNPRLMSPILSIPTNRPFSTTGMRRKFFSPM